MLGFNIDAEDGSNIFFRNFGEILSEFTASDLRNL
jgi:hypothetical protein